MSKKRNYDEVSVINALSRKSGCEINGKAIYVESGQTDLGNKSWGKIDYLVKVHKYVYTFVPSINKVRAMNNSNKRVQKENITPKVATKTSKGGKVDMANMAKNSMNKARK